MLLATDGWREALRVGSGDGDLDLRRGERECDLCSGDLVLNRSLCLGVGDLRLRDQDLEDEVSLESELIDDEEEESFLVRRKL